MTGIVLGSVTQSLDEKKLRRLEGLKEENEKTQERTDANVRVSIKPEKRKFAQKLLYTEELKLKQRRRRKMK